MMSKLRSALKHKLTGLAALLQTDNPTEQIQRVQQLMRPTLTLAIQLDARSGQVSLTNIGPEVPIQVAHSMLDSARTALVQMQAQQQAQQSQPPAVNTPLVAPESKEE